MNLTDVFANELNKVAGGDSIKEHEQLRKVYEGIHGKGSSSSSLNKADVAKLRKIYEDIHGQQHPLMWRDPSVPLKSKD
jgi:hypothetical protein